LPWQQGSVGREYGSVKLADPDNPMLEPNRKWIEWSVAEIWSFKVLPGRLFQEGKVSRSLVGRHYYTDLI